MDSRARICEHRVAVNDRNGGSFGPTTSCRCWLSTTGAANPAKKALLRREGLYSSLVTDWRRQHREGTLVVTEGRGSEGGRGAPSANEVARLRAENERLKVKLAKAEAIIAVQGKVQALLEQLSKSADNDDL